MNKFIVKVFTRYISVLLVNAVLFSGNVFASEKPIVYCSTLSPKVAISVAEFSRIFEVRFAIDIALLGKQDKIDERKGYAKGFYRLSFQTLLPKVIQRLLVNGIKSHILSKLTMDNVRSIDVEMKETGDPHVNRAYQFFQQTGESNLNDLADNTQLIDFLLKTIGGKRIDTAGFPSQGYRTQSGKIKRDKKVREWYSVAIAAVKGEPAKNFLRKPLWLLRKLYYRYILIHKFGDELRKSAAKGGAVIFSVSITLEDGTLVQKEITIAKKDNQIVIQTSKEKQVTNGDISAEEEDAKFLFEHLDSPTRQQLHILSDPENANNQVNDFLTTALLSDSLLKALETSRNKSGANFTRADRVEIEQLVRRVINWAERTPKQGGVQEKQQAGKLLREIIASDGYLKNGEPEKTVLIIEEAFGLIKKRMEWLIERIKRRNDIILAKAVFSHDRILYIEGLKNKIIETQGRIRLGQMGQARVLLSFLKKELSKEYEFNTRHNFGASLKDVMDALEQVETKQVSEQALGLIEEVDFYVRQQADNLRAIYKWFTDRGFDKYSSDSQMSYTQILSEIIKDLDSIQTPGIKYLDVINGVISKIDNLGKSINSNAKASGKIKGVQAQILPRLRGVRKALVLTRAKVFLRNVRLKQMQERNYRYTDVFDARNQLKRTIGINRLSGSYNELIEEIQENLNTLYVQVLNMQQDIFDQQEPKQIGDILKQLLEDKKGEFEQRSIVNRLVLQAI
ncbi:MAG: hypothetical protein L6416_04780 [Candidatus Omnitrophica bacterium]|nr:hypothetical protein [Candidatus Omnitrophota bacterium]